MFRTCWDWLLDHTPLIVVAAMLLAVALVWVSARHR